MNLPQPDLKTPFNITRASHLTLSARDLGRSRAFYENVIGLVTTEGDGSTLYLRGVEESCHHSITLKQSDDGPYCEAIGFRVFSDEDLFPLEQHFRKAGLPTEWVELEHQGRTLRTIDRSGTRVEFCASMSVQPRLHTRTELRRGGAALRLDHYQVLVPEPETAIEFYLGLGFRISDYMVATAYERVMGVFLHRKNNPWDVVFLRRDGPRLHHIGYITESMADMIRACDAAAEHGFADSLEHGPGRHGGTHSYFTYFRDPDGHRIELLLPPIQLMDIEDEPVRYDMTPGISLNAWGSPTPESWIKEATPFAGVEVNPMAPL